MKNLKNIFTMALVTTCMSACTGFLDIEPETTLTGKNFYKSPDDIRSALYSTYSSLRDNGLYSASIYLFGDVRSDVAFPNQTNYYANTFRHEIEKFTISANNSGNQNYWAHHYKGIIRANTVIEKGKELFGNDEAVQKYIAEAEVLRALFYFNLVRAYGGVPIIMDIPQEYTDSRGHLRASTEEVYIRILTDLTTAIESNNLYRSTNNGEKTPTGRVNKYAAEALLGKVLLSMPNDITEAAYPNVEAWKDISANPNITVFYPETTTTQYEAAKSNNDRQWNENTTTLKVVITPPWWRSTFAYFVYVLMLLGWIGWMAWRWNLRVKRKYKRRMEKYQTAKEQEVYKSKISFFINLVHEIRTPLSLIRLPLEKLLEKEREGKDLKYLSVIDKNVNYLLGITNELLDFQKMESGTLHLNLKKSDIKELVSDVYNQFTSPAELKGIDLQLTVPEQELVSTVDRDKLSKILVNLMGNAIKYAHARIDLKLLVTDGGYEIQVNDDGPGIPNEQKQKIFEAFYQLPDDKVATAVGTGIGLAFAKSLAEAHQGDLRLEDNIGGGSSFILSLPVKEWETEKTSDIVEISPEHADASETISSEYSGKKFTVLLVEDNVDLLNLTRESLAEWFRVLRASNGREALEVLAQENVDVIVSDVMMPEMDGLELCSKVKSEISYSHIPVILLTAKTTLESKVEGLECGADVYVEKPFSVKQLHMQIENLLKLRQSFHKLMVSLAGDTVAVSTTDFAMSQKDCEFIAKIQGVIAEQLADENFSIDTLAEQMNMSRSNFYRKIKALSGMSPNDYLKTLRMNRAAELIMGGTRISEVAVQVGFTSSSYFAKCFKAQYGVLPKEYTGQPPISGEA